MFYSNKYSSFNLFFIFSFSTSSFCKMSYGLTLASSNPCSIITSNRFISFIDLVLCSLTFSSSLRILEMKSSSPPERTVCFLKTLRAGVVISLSPASVVLWFEGSLMDGLPGMFSTSLLSLLVSFDFLMLFWFEAAQKWGL